MPQRIDFNIIVFAIPESLRVTVFESGILFVVIIVTSVIMDWLLITNGKKKGIEPDEKFESAEFETDVLRTVDLPLE